MKIHNFEINPDNTFCFDDNELQNKINKFIALKEINENNIINVKIKDISTTIEVKKLITLFVREV